MSEDMAARLARMQSMMSSMGSSSSSRRRSTGNVASSSAAPPKTPLTGGHALRRRVSASNAPTSPGEQQQSQPAPRRLSNAGTLRRGSLLPLAQATSAFEAMTESEAAGAQASTSTPAVVLPLLDVVAFVDVRTTDGDDASQVFVDMLRTLGARVRLRLACS
jgi:hypothetical protein